MNPCGATVEGRLGVNSAELDQLDSTVLGLEKPVSKCSMFGGERDSSSPPLGDVTRATLQGAGLNDPLHRRQA